MGTWLWDQLGKFVPIFWPQATHLFVRDGKGLSSGSHHSDNHMETYRYSFWQTYQIDRLKHIVIGQIDHECRDEAKRRK